MRTTWAFIDQYALEQGIKKRTLEKWRQRGVPYRFRLAIVLAAHRAGFMIAEADFAPPRRRVNGRRAA